MNYYLMNKDNVVATFSKVGEYGSLDYKLNKTFGKLPYGFNNINIWLESRQAGSERSYIKELMEQCGCNEIGNFIKATHCVSINDTFWVKSVEEDIEWEDVSLYRNKFNESVSRLAFEGKGSLEDKYSLTSPEFAIGGRFYKCCVRGLDNEVFILKRGTDDSANSGLEPYCESISSELYNIITKDSVEYKLVDFNGRKASKCKVFTSEFIGFVPFFLLSDLRGTAVVEFYDKLGDGDKFRNMLVADAVCFNEDRHSRSHGVLINNDTLEIIGMAPVFNNNKTLLPYAISSSFDDVNKYMEGHNTKVGDDWVKVARAALTERARTELVNLHGYEFKFEGDDKFSKQRVKVLSRMVNQQIKNILGKGEIFAFTDISGHGVDKLDRVGKLSARAAALLNL